MCLSCRIYHAYLELDRVLQHKAYNRSLVHQELSAEYSVIYKPNRPKQSDTTQPQSPDTGSTASERSTPPSKPHAAPQGANQSKSAQLTRKLYKFLVKRYHPDKLDRTAQKRIQVSGLRDLDDTFNFLKKASQGTRLDQLVFFVVRQQHKDLIQLLQGFEPELLHCLDTIKATTLTVKQSREYNWDKLSSSQHDTFKRSVVESGGRFSL